MTPGIHNLPEEEYHKDPCPAPSLSAGIVEVLNNQSPLHAWFSHPRLNPEYHEKEDTKFDIGTAAHALLFEGEDKAVIVNAEDWRTKAAREQRDAIRAEGKLPLLARHHGAVSAMVSQARKAWERNEDLKGYPLDGGKNEHAIIWEEAGTWFRCKPDHLSADRRLIVDAKFTETSANPNAFIRQIDRMAYDSRGAFYLLGNAFTGGATDARYVYLVQEQAPPFAACFIALSPAYVDLGHRKVNHAVAIWRDCLKRNYFPGYPTRICYAEPPAWVQAQWDEQEMAEGIEYDPAQLWEKPK